MCSEIHVRKVVRTFPALLLVILIASCSQEKVLTIGTGSTAGNYDKTGLAIASILSKGRKAHGILLQVKESSGSVANINALASGDIQFGIAQADRQYEAVNGLAEWKVKGPQKELRSICSLYLESVTIIADRAASIKNVRDLKGKRVDIGPPGSGIRQNAIDVLDAAGIKWNRDLKAHAEGADERMRMLMQGDLDAVFHTVGHPSNDILFLANSMRKVHFLPVDNVESLLAKYPYYSKSVIPVRGLYPNADNSGDIETIGVKATLLTSAMVPDELVYLVTKEVFSHIEELGERVSVLMAIDKNGMLEGLTAPLHPGAIKYFREIGLPLPASRR